MFKIFTPHVIHSDISWETCQEFLETNGVYSYQSLKQSSLILNTHALQCYEEEIRDFMYTSALKEAQKFTSTVISSRPIYPESEDLTEQLNKNGIRYYYYPGKKTEDDRPYIWFEHKEIVNFPQKLDANKLSSYRSFLKRHVRKHMKDSLNHEVILYPNPSETENGKDENLKIHLRGNYNVDAMIIGRIPLNFMSNYLSTVYYSQFLHKLGSLIDLSTYAINNTNCLFAAYHLSRYIGWEHFAQYITTHIKTFFNIRTKLNLTENGSITKEIKNEIWRLSFQDLINPFFLLFEEKFHPIFYRKTLKAALRNGPDYIYQLSQQIEGIYHDYSNPSEREEYVIRLGQSVRNNISILDLKHFTTQIKIEREQEWINQNSFDTPAAQDFMAKVKKYVLDTDFSHIADRYGLNTLKEFIAGTTSDFFEPQTFQVNYYPDLGETIRNAVGKRGKGAQVKNAGKLFSRLSKLGHVPDFIHGHIPCSVVSEIVKLLKEYRMDIPDSSFKAQEIHAKIEKKGCPEFLVAGNASVCCMPLGQDNAVNYAHEHGYGLLNVYYHGRIIANSVLWINEYKYGRTLVIDNIEVAPNYVYLNSHIQSLYYSLIPELCEQHNCILAAQGAAYSDLDLPNLFVIDGYIRSVDARLPEWELNPIAITNADTSYTDAHSTYPIWFASPMTFERILLDLKKQLKIGTKDSSNVINEAANI